jgi:hypothetical protein
VQSRNTSHIFIKIRYAEFSELKGCVQDATKCYEMGELLWLSGEAME